MTRDRFGAISLTLGALGVVVVMVAHPTPADFAAGRDLQASIVRNLLVHGGGIASTALLTFGFWRFTLHQQRTLAQLAFVFFAFAAIPWMFAAIMSGYAMTPLLAALRDAEEPARTSLTTMAGLTGRFNMAYSAVYAAMSSVAFVLFALAWQPTGLSGWVPRIMGLIVGAGTLALFFSGMAAQLGVHGWLGVVVAQFLFCLCCAAPLWRGTPGSARAEPLSA